MSLFKRGFNSVPHKTLFRSQEVKEQVTVPVPSPIVLDNEQDLIVHSDSKNMIVVAGAGSGKTRTLTERIEYLVREKKVNPVNIVAITFTNMASEEMKTRLINVPYIGNAFIGTIHSFANRIMKESGEKYTLFSDEVDIQLHKLLISRFCKSLTIDRYIEWRDTKTLVDTGRLHESRLQNFFIPSELSEFNMLHQSCDEVKFLLKNNRTFTFGESIATLCKKRNIITFDELLTKAKNYFDKINAKVEYCFVDEFQDVGILEYNFIRSLNAEHYFFVGDDWQAIYGFKGGNVAIFKSLVNSPEFDTYYLTNNYRNGSAILEFASRIIEQCDNIIQKDITPISTESGCVAVRSKKQIDDVLFEVKSFHNYKDWFILCRTNKEVFEIQDRLYRAGIPSVTFKREGMTLEEMNKLLYSDRVKVLTVHVSKGLETDNVIMYGNFPVYVPYYRKNDEERRVMYVGITRAKKKLYVLN